MEKISGNGKFKYRLDFLLQINVFFVMMNNIDNDVLPDCWIKKQSKTRPDHVYYFNTVTKESQWTTPVSADDKLRKNLKPIASPGKSDGSSYKISNHSKQSK